MPPTCENQGTYFSVILSPYALQFATAFLLRQPLSFPFPTILPFLSTPPFLGMFRTLSKKCQVNQEEVLCMTTSMKTKHREKTPEKRQYHLSNPWSPFALSHPLYPGLVYELLDLLLHPK